LWTWWSAWRRGWGALAALGLLLLSVPGAVAQFPGDRLSGEDSWPMPTLGGAQNWSDEAFFYHWRIQRNVLTQQFRLVDARGFRRASGNYVQCRAVLEKIKAAEHCPPMRGRGVIVLHGLGKTPAMLDKLARYLHDEGGYTIFNVGYASTQAPMADHAQSLGRVIRSLEGIESVDFVAHSMGNIVLRHYLGDHTDPATGEKPDPRIRRIVMLGPPNRGSIGAAIFGETLVFNAVTGPSGKELGLDWQQLEPHLATPACEFGIIAGGLGDQRGFNPLLPGDDDGVITVASTRLSGAADFTLVPTLHSPLVDDRRVWQMTLRFLDAGYFLSPHERNPLP